MLSEELLAYPADIICLQVSSLTTHYLCAFRLFVRSFVDRDPNASVCMG